MEQKPNKLSLIYDINQEYEVINLYFNIQERLMHFNCSCFQEKFCYHIEYIIEYLYNSYKNDYVDDIKLKVFQNENNLWLPVSETDENKEISKFIETEIQICNEKTIFYCSHCGGIHPVQQCRHIDYVIQAMIEHYQNLKEENEEINNMDLEEMNL